MDCHTPGAQKSTDLPRGAHLAGLLQPSTIHCPPRVILLTLCSDHLAGRGDHLPLRCVHLACRGGPHCHRANRLPPGAAHPAGPDRHRAVHLDPSVVQLAPRVGHLAGPIRQCDREIRVLDSNPFTIQFRWRPQYSFDTEGTPRGPRGLECCDPFAWNLEFFSFLT
jgi:hypothetical protein